MENEDKLDEVQIFVFYVRNNLIVERVLKIQNTRPVDKVFKISK